MSKISVDEFTQRLEALYLSQGGPGLPRRRLDRDILFASIIVPLAVDRTYTEPEVNQALRAWSSGIGRTIDIDYVSLRRYLVDEGYLVRDPAGTMYRVGTEVIAERFEPAIGALDPAALIEAAQERRLQRKRRRQEDAHPSHREGED